MFRCHGIQEKFNARVQFTPLKLLKHLFLAVIELLKPSPLTQEVFHASNCPFQHLKAGQETISKLTFPADHDWTISQFYCPARLPQLPKCHIWLIRGQVSHRVCHATIPKATKFLTCDPPSQNLTIWKPGIHTGWQSAREMHWGKEPFTTAVHAPNWSSNMHGSPSRLWDQAGM